jgi:hypothetical protein
MRTLLPALRPSLATRRLGARLALFALLVAAVVPTFSRLLQPVGLDDWATLCVSAASSSEPTQDQSQRQHDADDACALCSIAHTTPAIGGVAAAQVAVVPYAPPAPPAPAAVRTRVAQSRAPGARAPPFAA